MMAGIRIWLVGAVFTAFAVSLARQLAPGDREKRLVGLAGGILMLLAIFHPLVSPQLDELILPTFSADVAAQALQQERQDALAAIIAEKTGAYISDKSRQLGGATEVAVVTEVGESGIPLPWSVTLRGQYDPALSQWIEQELAIPAQRQKWLEGEKWTEDREK